MKPVGSGIDQQARHAPEITSLRQRLISAFHNPQLALIFGASCIGLAILLVNEALVREEATVTLLLAGVLAVGALFLLVLLTRQQAMQTALRNSESRFRALSALGSDWYWETDVEYRLMRLSEGFSRISGLPATELLDRPYWDNPLMKPVGADWTMHKAVIARYAPFRDLVVRHVSPQGLVAYGSVRGEPMFDKDGNFRGYRGVGNDITAEIVLRQRLRMQHDVTRILSQEKDAGQAIRAVIETICRTMEWGWGAHRHLDPDTLMLTCHEYWLAPGIHAEAFVAFAQLSKQGDAERGTVSRAILRSEILWFTDHQSSSLRRSKLAREAGLRGAVAVPVRRGRGTADALEFFSARVEAPDQITLDTLDAIGRELGQFMDRVAAQQASTNLERLRRHLLDRLELQLEHMPIACLIQDRDFRIVYCNPAAERVFGYAASEMQGRDTVEFLVPESGRALVWERRSRLRSGEHNITGMNENVAKGGRVIICEWSIMPLYDEQGAFAGALVVAQDVTERTKMVAALEDSEERHRQIFAAAPLPMWVADVPVPHFLEVNDAAVRKYGYTREELMRMTVFDLQLPEDRERVSAEILGRDSAISAHFERRHMTRDGRELLAEVTAQPFQFGGRPARLIIVNDVTERRRAQQALEQSEARYRQIFALTPLPMFLRGENSLRFVDVNDACLQTYGYTREEMLALTVADIQMPGERESFKAAAATWGGKIERLHKQHMRKSGEIFDVEIFSYPTRLGDEQVRLALVRDITEELHSEQLLRDSERRVALALESSGGALFDWNIVTGTVYLSDRWNAMLGGPLGETQTTFQALEDMMHPEDIAGQRAAIIRLLKSSSKPHQSEFRVRTRAGNWIWIESRGSVVESNADGRALRVLGTNIDITQRKQDEIALRERDALLRESAAEIRNLNTELEQRVEQRTSALAEANRELEMFSYSVSHDLRAPLRTIDGFSQILLDEYAAGLDATGRGYLERVRAGSQRMAKLIDDLLELARVTRRDLLIRQCDLTALAREIAGELQVAEPARQVRLMIAEDMQVMADSGLLRIALDNLLRNAWKFTRFQSAALIEVGCAEDEGANAYFVRDNGVGFDMAYVSKLFGAFQRLHSEAEFQGTGIGLALVQRVIRRHGGQVWAEAELDHGATFFFTFPAQAAIFSDPAEPAKAET